MRRQEAGFRSVPISLVFTGHMIDLPGRTKPRFPASLEHAARREIKKRVERCLQAVSPSEFGGFASGARGGDILFHEVCRGAGTKTALILPFPPQRFLAKSVKGVPNSHWVERFWKLWDDREHSLFTEAMGLPETDDAYALCNTRVLELAKTYGEVHLIALWDGKGGDGPGSTADLVRQARWVGDAPDIFAPRDLRGGKPRPVA
jgi:hypothetical protein